MVSILAAWTTTPAVAAPVQDWMDAVVLVQQGTTMCAGVRIDANGTVATAYHCVAPGGRPLVSMRNGARAVGRIQAVDVANDLALIAAPALSGDGWLPVATSPPTPGEEVWALGHPLGGDAPGGFFEGTLRWSASSGHVSAVGSRSLQLDAAVNPGNSGGPVVDEEGHVVGIVSRRLGGEGLSYAARGNALSRLQEQTHRRPGPLGGTVALEPMLASLDSASGSVSVGGRLQIAVRDRVVFGGAVLAPLSHRWNAARFGRSDAIRALATAGLRQRFGRGSWAPRVDGWGGVAWLDHLESDPATPLSVRSTAQAAAMAGGTLRVRAVGFEVGALLPSGGTWTAVSLGWPGVVTAY